MKFVCSKIQVIFGYSRLGKYAEIESISFINLATSDKRVQ